MRTRSPRMAPPVKGLLGSTASTPTRAPSARRWRTSAAVSVDFPAPGAPVTPMVHALSATETGSAVIAARASSSPVSTIERRRASAPRSPPRTASTNPAGSVTALCGSGEGLFVDEGVVDDGGDAGSAVHDDALNPGLEGLHRDRARPAGPDEAHMDHAVVIEVVEHDVAAVALEGGADE